MVHFMALVYACVFCEEKAGDEQNAAGQVSLFPSSGSWQVFSQNLSCIGCAELVTTDDFPSLPPLCYNDG
ncbi:rCG29169 [Rattus norvegicus]|uniref:RCG29169 n=1 Tax=Rattus norvegicus TaxID=10116 RepID=A6K8B7_RAT|nr:rCG29169 [Rattus norvegicus]